MNTPDTNKTDETIDIQGDNINTPDTEWESFEKYLEHVCFKANPTVLDDDMPDFFDDWLGNQNGEDYIRLADEYATSRDTYWKERVEKVKAEVRQEVAIEALETLHNTFFLPKMHVQKNEDGSMYLLPIEAPTPITKDNLK